MALPPDSFIFLATSSAFSIDLLGSSLLMYWLVDLLPSMSDTTTFAPSFAKSRAASAPIP